MRYHLVSISSEIYEDRFFMGTGEYTGCGLPATAIGLTFDTYEGMLNHLSSTYCHGVNVSDYEGHDVGNVIQTSALVANHSDAQNGGWFEPTEQELTLWKAGEIMLYSEEFYIRYLKVI